MRSKSFLKYSEVFQLIWKRMAIGKLEQVLFLGLKVSQIGYFELQTPCPLPKPPKNTGSFSAASSLCSHLSVRRSTILPNHPSHMCPRGTSDPFRFKCRPIMPLQLRPALVNLEGLAQHNRSNKANIGWFQSRVLDSKLVRINMQLYFDPTQRFLNHPHPHS